MLKPFQTISHYTLVITPQILISTPADESGAHGQLFGDIGFPKSRKISQIRQALSSTTGS
jgi:hypothetical protein